MTIRSHVLAFAVSRIPSTVTEPWVTQVTGEAVFGFPSAEYERVMAASAAQILSKASEAAKEVGLSCATIHVKERHPAGRRHQRAIRRNLRARRCAGLAARSKPRAMCSPKGIPLHTSTGSRLAP